MKQLRLILVLLIGVASVKGFAQTSVRGHIVNERGETIEYVSIGIENDSIGTISDVKGNFTIDIPAGRKGDLTFTHVSYQTATIPYTIYTDSRELIVTLKDKVVKLAEIVVGKKNKPQTVAGKSISGPVASFRGKGKPNAVEWGPVFKSKHDSMVSDILLTVKSSSYQWCVLSFNIYEVRGSQFVNILNKPIYYRLEEPCGKLKIDIRPEETVMLKGKHKYFISMSVVDSDRYGILELQSQFKSSYARSFAKGKKRKLPVGPAIIVKGY